MEKLNFGDIVLLKFPYTDGKTFKKRPVLLINDCGDGDIVVCRITSQIYNSPFDIFIETWANAGLKLPSVIRVHKIATLEKIMVENKLGKIEPFILNEVKAIIKQLTE